MGGLDLWLSVDLDGNISGATSTDPTAAENGSGEEQPEYNIQLFLTYDQMDNLSLYVYDYSTSALIFK